MFTIIQFLRVRANIHTVLEGQQDEYVYCIQGNNRLETVIDQSLTFVCSIETFILQALPSGFVLLNCIQWYSQGGALGA